MVRNKLTIELKKRKPSSMLPLYPSYTDYHFYLDIWSLWFVSDAHNNLGFVVVSKRFGKAIALIPRTEEAFVRLVNSNYGAGDYTIQCFARGHVKDKKRGIKYKNTGRRRFWDGVITTDGMWMRKVESNTETLISRSTMAIYTESFIAKWFKTKQPSKFYQL